VLQPQPEAPQAPQPEPETEVGQPEPPVVVELVNAAPSVVAATPSDGQIGVGLSPKVQVTFSEPMDKASVEAAFQMVAPVMAGTFSWNSAAPRSASAGARGVTSGSPPRVAIAGRASKG
jgi:hypothetical protein